MERVDFRTLRAYLRDTWLLVREFRYSLLVFLLLILVGTVILRFAYDADQPLGWGDALDTTVKLMFFETTHEYPRAWPAQVVFFLWPLLGVVLVANGVVQLVVFASLEALACLNRMNGAEGVCPPEERKRPGWLSRLRR